MAALWKKLCRVVEHIEGFLITWLTLGFGLLILYNVTIRKIGFSSLPWIDEFSRYMLVATTMIGCAMIVKSDGHIKMDLLTSMLRPRAKRWLMVFVNLFNAAFWFFFCWYGAEWTLRLKELGKSVECMKLPFWPFWIPFVVASFIAGVRYLELLVDTIRSIVHPPKPDEEAGGKEGA